LTVSSRDPVVNPSPDSTTCSSGYGRIGRISVNGVVKSFVELVAVLTAGVTAGTYAYEAWNWFQSIHWLW